MIGHPSGNAPRVYLTTLGCKLNQYDGEMLLSQLRADGYRETESAGEADLIVVNTCAVTETAERKGRAAIRAALRQNARATLVATGCMAERDHDALKQTGAHKVIGNREKERFLQMLNAPESVLIGGVRRDEAWSDGTVVQGLQGRTRAFLKVQDGCSQFCTYCIVPKLRGAGRSLPVAAAVERARELVDRGFNEIVLTGVALGTYGADTGQSDALPGLLRELGRIPGLRRLRIGSVEPWAVTETFLNTVAESDVICPHLHLPFQSADDQILRRMNRRYTTAHIEWILERAYHLRQDWGIGADIIVGFPGETESRFESTRRFLESSSIAYLHVFPFSQRPETSAEKLPGRVEAREIAARADALRAVSRTLRARFNQQQVGRVTEVLLERRQTREHILGHAANYADIAVPREDACSGDLLKGTAVAADADFVYCKPQVKHS